MIWFSWLQFRMQAMIGFGLLAAFAIVLAVTGPHLAHVYDTFESACRTAGDCATAPNPALNVDKSLQSALPLIVAIAPALIGLFFGAPLVARELETGTFRLIWTQGATRRQWLAAKLGLVGLGAMALGGLLTWIVDWWASPLNAVNQDRFGVANFGFNGIAPIGYAAFAFALGATAGVLLRRTVAAMAVTGGGFAAARLAVTYWVRPHFAAPVTKVLSLSAGAVPGFVYNDGHGGSYINANVTNGFHMPPVGGVELTAPAVKVPNGWVYSTTAVDKAGHAPTSHYLLQTCPVLKQMSGSQQPSAARLQACVNTLSKSFHTVLTYQPASRFWPFQWAETVVFLAAASALCGLTYWWLRHRIT